MRRRAAALVAAAVLGAAGAAAASAPGSAAAAVAAGSAAGPQTVCAVSPVLSPVPRTVRGTVPHTVPHTVRGTGDTGDSARGTAAYAKACESCHGPDAKGGTAPALVPFTLELSELIAIVRQGIGVMPGIPRDRVSDEEISAIRDYLVGLKN